MVAEWARAAGEGEPGEGAMHSVSQEQGAGPCQVFRGSPHPAQTLPAEKETLSVRGQSGDSQGSWALLAVCKNRGPAALPSFLHLQGAPRTCGGGGSSMLDLSTVSAWGLRSGEGTAGHK